MNDGPPSSAPVPAHPADALSRSSFLSAGLLGVIGICRLVTDFLTDVAPHWADALGDHPVRYLVRTASDGSQAADLNVQWFKVLAIPCAVGVVYYLNLALTGSVGTSERRWRSPGFQALMVGILWGLCTMLELEKSTHFMGLWLAGLQAGELAGVNHLAHLISAALGFGLIRWLRYVQ